MQTKPVPKQDANAPTGDLLNHQFDRSYNYDHNTRITEALSGAEARGEGETIGRPYKQTYSYDAFSHLTARTSLVWNYSVPPTSDTYANNRRTGWVYDADGNLLNGADGTYTYDAAGRISEVGSFDPLSSTTRGVDGDGLQLRTVEVAYHEDTSTWVTTKKYYLHSTVLGGRVLTELNESGAKTRTFVYAGGTVLAWQQFVGTNEEVLWEHRDPSNASFRMADSGGGVWQSGQAEPAELDPAGANARTHAPFINEPPPEYGGSLLPYGSFVTFGNGLSRSYSLDGIPVTVDFALRSLESGAAVISPNSSGDSLLGIGAVPIYGRFCVGVGGGPLECTHEITGYTSPFSGMTSLQSRPTQTAPLNAAGPGERPMTPEDIARLKSDMEYLLTDENCMSFVNNLVTKAMEQNPQQTLAGGLVDVFDKVQAQTKGGYFWAANVPGSTLTTGALSGGGGYAQMSLKWNNAKTVLGDASFFSPFRTAEDLRVIFAVGALHETIHQMTGLDDTKLSIALATLLGDDPAQAKGSLYWGQPLDSACATALKAALRKPGAKKAPRK